MADEFLHTKKTLWNSTRKVTIMGFDVEMFVQNDTEHPSSAGIYSLMKNKWLSKPEKVEHDFDHDKVKRITKKLMNGIDSVIGKKEDKNLFKKLNNEKKSIRSLRQKGLDRSGEFSEENLAFKILRRNGYLDKLHNHKIKVYDDIMSL
jgi:hypothetical protein